MSPALMSELRAKNKVQYIMQILNTHINGIFLDTVLFYQPSIVLKSWQLNENFYFCFRLVKYLF